MKIEEMWKFYQYSFGSYSTRKFYIMKRRQIDNDLDVGESLVKITCICESKKV